MLRMAAVHLLIKGRVQGVFYRASARQAAEQMHLTGWIKNTKEGDVEALVSGSDHQVQQFVDWCRQGPPKAQVTDVIVSPAAPSSFTSFNIVR